MSAMGKALFNQVRHSDIIPGGYLGPFTPSWDGACQAGSSDEGEHGVSSQAQRCQVGWADTLAPTIAP